MGFLDVPGIKTAGHDIATAAKVSDAASATRAQLDLLYPNKSLLGKPNGIPTLDAGGKIPAAQIPGGAIASNLYGTYANRPTAAVAGSGATYYASDVSETYRSNGTTWQVVGVGGAELGYAEIATDFTTASTTKVDVTGLSVTFKAGERPIEVSFGGLVQAATAGGRASIHILLDGSMVAEVPNRIDATANGYMVYERKRRLPAMTPGSTHVVKIQASSTGGNMTVFGVSTNPAGLSVVNR